MRFPRYTDYRDSEVEWLGVLPAHWRVTRLGNLFAEVDERGSADLPVLSVSIHDGVSDSELDESELDRKVTRSEDRSKYKRVAPGDLAYNMMRAWQGGFGTVTVEGMVSPAYVVARPTAAVPAAYVEHLLRTPAAVEEMRRYSRGVTDFRLRLYWDEFKNIAVPIPTVQEQQSVLAFLDHETSKIDALVDEQKRLIELLKEKRQSVISHAVTNGLDPDVPMKDSGVEWLGQIPTHWDVRAIKHIVSTPVTDGPHETPEFPDEGVPFVSAEAVSAGFVNFEKIRGFISESDHARYSVKYQPRRGDIFMVKSGATTGVTAIVETDQDFNIWSPLAVIRCGNQSAPHFILNFMRSKNFLEAVTLSWSFGTQQNIGMGVIENLAVPVPPIREQEQIAKFLLSEAKKLNDLTAEAECAIALLQERRAALISAAVTGKIDVRNWRELQKPEQELEPA